MQIPEEADTISPDDQEVLRKAEAEGVRFVRLQFIDLEGIAKNVEIPVAQLGKALAGEIAFDGSSVDGFARTEESDMLLKPDPSTFAIYPWGDPEEKTAQFHCDVFKDATTPFESCPRMRLKAVVNLAKEAGYHVNIGPEPEFFLFRQDAEGNPIPRNAHDTAGYFDLSPADKGEKTRRRIVLALDKMGFDIEASHHEVAEGQHEIDFKYADPLTTADRVMTFKFVTKQMALLDNLYATFMPKPLPNVNGSCMHTHISLHTPGRNEFFDETTENQLSEMALHFIGGILNHAPALTAITNPTINSFKRLRPGFEAPTRLTWSEADRSALIRVPASRGNSTRLEYRSPDPSCNPYLAFAGIIAAGMDGVNNETQPDGSAHCRVNKESNGVPSLPLNLGEALDALENDPLVRGVLGEHLYTQFMAIKKAEWNEYINEVHDWEIKRYLERL